MAKLRFFCGIVFCILLVTPFLGCNAPGGPHNIVDHTVTFNSNGGSAVQAQQVLHGQIAARPADPIRNFYTFVDWYSDANLTNVFDFNTPITGNITLFASWITTRTLWLYMDNVEIPPDPLFNNFENLDDIFAWIAGNAVDLRTYRIVLGKDIVMQNTQILGSNSVRNRTNVTIILEGREKERVVTNIDTLFGHFELNFGSTNTFVLGRNITLDGVQGGGGVFVTTGRFEMRDDAKIINSRSMGVWVGAGTFIMNEGTITGNGADPLLLGNGGGVFVTGSGRFEMKGGTISNNTGTIAGGVFVRWGNISNRGIFIKTGGTIKDNTSISGIGHSVYLGDSPNTIELLNNTVAEDHDLDSRVAGAAGGWVDR